MAIAKNKNKIFTPFSTLRANTRIIDHFAYILTLAKISVSSNH